MPRRYGRATAHLRRAAATLFLQCLRRLLWGCFVLKRACLAPSLSITARDLRFLAVGPSLYYRGLAVPHSPLANLISRCNPRRARRTAYRDSFRKFPDFFTTNSRNFSIITANLNKEILKFLLLSVFSGKASSTPVRESRGRDQC